MAAGLSQIERSIAAAVLLARRDPGAMGRFNLTVEGFWHSFLAAVIVFPIALLFFVSERRLWTEFNPSEAAPSIATFYPIETAAFALDWAIFPILMIFLLRQFGLSARYVPFIIAWNWSSVVSAFLIAPPIALYALGLVGAPVALIGNLLALVLVILYQQRVAETALGLPPLQALGLPLIDLFIGLFFDTLTGAIHGALAQP